MENRRAWHDLQHRRSWLNYDERIERISRSKALKSEANRRWWLVYGLRRHDGGWVSGERLLVQQWWRLVEFLCVSSWKSERRRRWPKFWVKIKQKTKSDDFRCIGFASTGSTQWNRPEMKRWDYIFFIIF